MAEHFILPMLDRAFQMPAEVLGTVERNTEIKIGLFTLWALGWDPVEDIACAAQIPRQKCGPTAKAAHAADFLVRDGENVCIIGEAKHWQASEKQWDQGVKQLHRYRKAIGVPAAFLTTGC